MRRLVLLLALALPLSAATFKSHDGTTLHYDVIGKGEPVLLLSGGPGFSPDYLRPIAEKLGDKYKFVLLHQRGTGKSVIETYDANAISLKNLVGDVEALRRELQIEKLTIAGHSFGGILSMMYAREHPERVGALALIDSGGPTLKTVMKFNANLESRFTDEDRALIKQWSDPERMKENRPRAALELTKAKAPAYFADRSKSRLLTDPMDVTSFHSGVFYSVVPQMMGLDIRAGLEKVKAPVLVLHGKQDPLESADEVHETFPGSKLEFLENAGHFPWLEQPDAFYAVLGGFLGGLDSCH
ncbi:MAG TPA: alpha/beta hydrolase [Thermoanaerobaculia bacterium]|jgi:proline iminopeptidase|nr:alpha/beta hydrolase [Thermoanaerobaculia bacterium]